MVKSRLLGAVLIVIAASGQAQQQPPNGVEVEIGMGSRIGRQVSNYRMADGILSLTNLGSDTPQLLTGLGFSCDTSTIVTSPGPGSALKVSKSASSDFNQFCNRYIPSQFGAFVSAQIGAGSNQAVSGYTIGITYALGKYLRILAGYSMTPSNEISPGFANAASQYVARNQSLFPGINPAELAGRTYGSFDGIATTSVAPASGAALTSTIYYPGAITETHYRGGLIVGVALPINIYSLLSGNSRNSLTQ